MAQPAHRCRLFVFDVVLIIHLGCLYRGKPLAEYSELLVGKAISRIFCGIYMVYFFIFLAFFVRSAAEIIQAEILYKTPVWATMPLIMSVSLYAASKGPTNLGRILEYLGLIVLITSFILQIIAFTQGNPLNNLPLIDPAETSRYIQAVAHGGDRDSLGGSGRRSPAPIPDSHRRDNAHAGRTKLKPLVHKGFRG